MGPRRVISNIVCGFIPNKKTRSKVRVILNNPCVRNYIMRNYITQNVIKINKNTGRTGVFIYLPRN